MVLLYSSLARAVWECVRARLYGAVPAGISLGNMIYTEAVKNNAMRPAL